MHVLINYANVRMYLILIKYICNIIYLCFLKEHLELNKLVSVQCYITADNHCCNSVS